MQRLVWPIVGLGLVIWSGLAWLVHSLVHWGGNLASSNVDMVPVEPEAVEWFSWLAVFGTDVVQWLVIVVWAIGAVALLAVGVLGKRIGSGLGGLLNRVNRPS